MRAPSILGRSEAAGSKCALALLLLTVFTSTATSTALAADRCEELIKMDGLFSRAFQACPLSFYSFRFRQDAKLCAEKLGEAVSKPLTAKGQQAFESRAKELGKDGICRKLVSDFPLTLKP